MNDVDTAKKVITDVLKENNFKAEKIILFGSRAQGRFTKDSDWDFYIIVDKEMDFPQKRKIITQMKRKLAELKIPNDIIIQPNSIVNERKNDVGYLTYYVLKEGVEIK